MIHFFNTTTTPRTMVGPGWPVLATLLTVIPIECV